MRKQRPRPLITPTDTRQFQSIGSHRWRILQVVVERIAKTRHITIADMSDMFALAPRQCRGGKEECRGKANTHSVMVKDSVHTTTGNDGRTVRHMSHPVAADGHRVRRRWRIIGVLSRRTWGEKENQQQNDRAMDGLSFHAYESKIMGAKIGRALFAAIGVAVAASEVWPGTRCNSTSSCTKHTSPASAEACAASNRHSTGFAQWPG